MRKSHRRVSLRSESIRILTDMGAVSGARPTSATFCDCAQAARQQLSEADGGGPCPGEYSFTCKP